MKFITEFLNSGTVKQQNRKRLGALLICITAALLAVALIVLAVFGIAGAIKNRGVEEEETEETGVQIPKGYVTTEFSKDQSANGTLLMLDASHPYTGSVTMVQSTPNTENRPTVEGTASGTPLYILSDYQNINFTAETLAAFNQMIVDFYAAKSADGYVAKALCVELASSELSVATKEIMASGTGVILTDQYMNSTIYDAETQTGKQYYEWIYDNAAKYGFVRASAVEGEEHIFRYVGVVHATYMTDKNLSFADYITKLHTTTGIGKTLKVTAEGVKYEIFYIAPGETHIKPESYDFTVSGDNMGGYIVTVNKTAQTDK